MEIWPTEETPLTKKEKNAYRFLLYLAMVDIRNLCQSRGSASSSPLEWWRQYQRSRIAGTLADWLHNLAMYASQNFKGFNAEHFWKEYDSISRRSPDIGPGCWLDYRKRYEEKLARSDKA